MTTELAPAKTTYAKAMGYREGANQGAQTPDALLATLNEEFHFDFDPCPAERPEWDGLQVDWGTSNYVNPPYRDCGKWLAKGLSEMRKGNRSVFLIPWRPTRKYYREIVQPHAVEIRFFREPVVFKDYTRPAPMGVCLIVFDPDRLPQQDTHFNMLRNVYTGHTGCKITVQQLQTLFESSPSDYVPFDFVHPEGDQAILDDDWGTRSFVVCNTGVSRFIDKAVQVSSEEGKSVILIVPLRCLAAYFLPKIIAGQCSQILAIDYCYINHGYEKPSLHGALALFFKHGRERVTHTGPSFSIV